MGDNKGDAREMMPCYMLLCCSCVLGVGPVHTCTPVIACSAQETSDNSIFSRSRRPSFGSQLNIITFFKSNPTVLGGRLATVYTLPHSDMLTCFHEVSGFSGNWSVHRVPHTLFPCAQRGPGGPLAVKWGFS